jgi:hypothetical protein
VIGTGAVVEQPDLAVARPPARRELPFDLVLEVVGQLVPEGPEELDAVVLGRVVRGADHDAGAGLELGREERDRGRRLDAGEDDVGARGPDPLGERPLERLARGARVAPDDQGRPMTLVAREHRHRRAPEPEREVVGQLAPVHAAYPVCPEEAPHIGLKATRNRPTGTRTPPARRCRALRPTPIDDPPRRLAL